ncbi:hypothetical protein [Halorarius halobius]|uniref:hypothetical protein n=1 Tax=Halorarius halobius TaxID=2962671 RepID=UPI0020CD7A73|nr:hypothetical protein [Halorarius halobius]
MTGALVNLATQHKASLKFLDDSVQWKISGGTAVDDTEIKEMADALGSTGWTAHFYDDGGDCYIEYHPGQ